MLDGLPQKERLDREAHRAHLISASAEMNPS
jgi:hypothetical protein